MLWCMELFLSYARKASTSSLKHQGKIWLFFFQILCNWHDVCLFRGQKWGTHGLWARCCSQDLFIQSFETQFEIGTPVENGVNSLRLDMSFFLQGGLVQCRKEITSWLVMLLTLNINGVELSCGDNIDNKHHLLPGYNLVFLLEIIMPDTPNLALNSLGASCSTHIYFCPTHRFPDKLNGQMDISFDNQLLYKDDRFLFWSFNPIWISLDFP